MRRTAAQCPCPRAPPGGGAKGPLGSGIGRLSVCVTPSKSTPEPDGLQVRPYFDEPLLALSDSTRMLGMVQQEVEDLSASFDAGAGLGADSKLARASRVIAELLAENATLRIRNNA